MLNFSGKERWRGYLVALAILIFISTFAFTYSITNTLKEVIRNNVMTYVSVLKEYSRVSDNPVTDTGEQDFTLALDLLKQSTNTRILVTDSEDNYINYRNIKTSVIENPKRYKRLLKKMKKNGALELDIEDWVAYYLPPPEYNYLVMMPIFTLVLLTLFLIFGYYGVTSSRLSEQNKVWVGLARETAHQLGTPISGIIAWIENLKTTPLRGDQQEIIEELENDIDRLSLIADRFSKIGAVPELENLNLETLLVKNMDYMSRRSPRRIEFKFEINGIPPILANVNEHLFNWVIENLLRNAVDASEGEGKITVELGEDDEFAIIDVIDTGKGIPANQVKKVFSPGFTTKKRGWGLGLSLAQRIIENYHKGKIFIKNSKVNEGTHFRIMVPK